MVSTRRSASAGASGTPSRGGGGGSSMARQASTDIPRIPLLGVVPGVEAFDAAIDRRSDYYRLQALSHHHAPPQAPLLVRKEGGCWCKCACLQRLQPLACR